LPQIADRLTGLVQKHWLLRYGFAVVMFGIVLGLGTLNSHYNAKINLTIPIVFAVVATVWYAGRGPGLLLSVLFEGTTIIYATVPPDVTPAKAWFGYFSVFLLYVFLVLLIGGLQRAREVVGRQRDLLHVTLSSIGDGVIATDPDGKITFMNPVAERLTGWQREDATGRSLEGVAQIVDESTRAQVANPSKKVIETGRVVGLANHSLLVAKDGSEVPIEDSAAPIMDGETIRGVVFVFSDVTERKLAERARRETEVMHRIVEAQEGERHRIARDLHDHLGQQMTALRLKVEALVEKCGADPEVTEALGEVRHSTVKIDRDIGFLSWELRPTELEELGLGNALGSFVREWSRQHGINAEFETHIASSARFGREIETNLYRITQEGLNNVLKHAEAGTVSVLLHQREDELVLIIEDDGKGFESGEGDMRTGPGGFGLTGMSERVALLKGSIEIDSRPGEGTTIISRIPLSVAAQIDSGAVALA
jgi:PAS domain S-box-containing protein